MASPTEIRARSLSIASRSGLSIAASLPLLEPDLHVRRQDEVVGRLFCLHVAAAVAYGFDRAKAMAWVQQEKLGNVLTNAEVCFVQRGEGRPQEFQTQVEGMWALFWTLGFVQKLDFWKDSGDNFVTLMPNLLVGQSSSDWYRKARTRAEEELLAACDLAYLLTVYTGRSARPKSKANDRLLNSGHISSLSAVAHWNGF
jgi:hypothetical protein